MSNYETAVGQFNNTKAGKLMSAIDDMEKDRLAGWDAFFKTDYALENAEKTILSFLDCLLEEALCRRECRK